MSVFFFFFQDTKKTLDFISHSASVLQLQFLYQVALADSVKDKVIVDIGSRLGAVLYTVSRYFKKNIAWIFIKCKTGAFVYQGA